MPEETTPPQQLSFEDALKRLEEIVHSFEDGKLGLAEALERYEEGVKLLRQSYDLLQRAERKIELLSGLDAEGNPITQPFDDTAMFNPAVPGSAASPAARRQCCRQSKVIADRNLGISR